MPRSRRRTKTDQDRILLRIYEEARACVTGRTRQQDVEDAVHDVVADCQAMLRASPPMKMPRNLKGFARQLVRNKIVDQMRRQIREDVSGAGHLWERSPILTDWQRVDHSWDEAEMAAFLDETTKKLPYRCRKAYHMVRVEGSTYKEAAARLRLSTHTVRNYVVAAQRLFRHELERIGVRVRTDHAVTCPDDSEARPDDAALVPADDATRTDDQSCRSTDDAPRTIRDDVRQDDDAPRTIDETQRPDRAASRPKAAALSSISYEGRTNRDARRLIHVASRPNHDNERTDDDAPWTQGNASRTDRNAWRTERAAALQVRETLSQEN